MRPLLCLLTLLLTATVLPAELPRLADCPPVRGSGAGSASWGRLTVLYTDFGTGIRLDTFTPDRMEFNLRNELGEWERLEITVIKRDVHAVFIGLTRAGGRRFQRLDPLAPPYLLQERFHSGMVDLGGRPYDVDPIRPGYQQALTRRIYIMASGEWCLLPLRPQDGD